MTGHMIAVRMRNESTLHPMMRIQPKIRFRQIDAFTIFDLEKRSHWQGYAQQAQPDDVRQVFRH